MDKTLGYCLQTTLKSPLKKTIAQYIQQQHMKKHTLNEVEAQLDKLLQTIETIPAGVNSNYTVVLRQKHAELANRLYCGLAVKKAGDETQYAIDFIPLAEIFRYPIEGYHEDAEVIADLIWDLTFDGWTCEEQREQIQAFENQVDLA